MIIISDRIIKFIEFILCGAIKNIAALTLWPFIFVRTDTIITNELINHEKIHLRQQIEMLVIPFYIVYLIELYKKGYMNISFEKEAYENDYNLNYLKIKKPYSFIKYL